MNARTLVIAAGLGLFFLAGTPALAARLYVSPLTKEAGPNAPFSLTVRIDTQGQCINAADISLVYPKDILEPVDVSRGDSIFTLWINSPTIHRDFGIVSFLGGIPNGYCGHTPGDPNLSNIIGKAIFRFTPEAASSTAPVTANVTVSKDSKVLLHDGRGSEAKLSFQGTKVILKKNAASADEWAQEIKSDNVPPDPFKIEVYQDPAVFDGQYFAVFSALDKQTGVDRYLVMETDEKGNDLATGEPGQWLPGQSPYILRDQSRRSIIQVKAIDKAGNEQIARYAPPAVDGVSSTPSKAAYYLMAAVAVVVLAALLKFLKFIPW